VIEFGKVYTWTISVPNSGNAGTRNLVVTETVAIGWQNITATLGSGGQIPTVVNYPGGGGIITWTIGSLANGSTWSASFSGEARDAATNYRTILSAHTECNTGGCGLDPEANAADIAFSTPLQSFNKSISNTPVSVGEPFSYTFRADFFATRVYTDVLITDTLPKLSGTLVFSITNVRINNNNTVSNTWFHGPVAGDVLTFTTNALGAREVRGPETLTVTITGLLSNTLTADREVR